MATGCPTLAGLKCQEDSEAIDLIDSSRVEALSSGHDNVFDRLMTITKPQLN